ncbi:MAG: diguanylate cyclase [Desulfuromonadaceae bacterium]|nr:diguanylate cyclase [Desulfuromonadaceae bacterium]MDD5107382.1 diguanylate cyclase [Desulfuromonadaceae bacterium]
MLPTKVTIISPDTQLTSQLHLRLHGIGCRTTVLSCKNSVMDEVYTDTPDLLIIDLSDNFEYGKNIISTLRNDSFFSMVPIIGLLSSIEESIPDWKQCPLDDFIGQPINFNELFYRVSLALTRLKRIFDNNPLTRLPGNTSIQMAIEDALGTSTAVCYVDINHFKPYNNTFGFTLGDEVIRMLARIVLNTVCDAGRGFCGHVGGDDFVCIVPLHRAELVCKTIITHFDAVVLDLFDDEIKQRGFYYGTTRKGEQENIPLLSLSIGVVPMNMHKLKHVAKVSEIAAELKKRAKISSGSSYTVDNLSS